jgi:mono/diheme cytochrome c family protein
LDAPHPASSLPGGRPSAAAGQEALTALPAEYTTFDYYAASSPAQAFEALRREPALQGLPDASVWDLVAALWARQAPPERIEAGRELYAQNCAACHGEGGQGDGVMARYLAEAAPAPAASTAGHASPTGEHGGTQFSGHEAVMPTDFTDPANMLGAPPALLQGKIVRGGMGTGMPYWGPVLTDEQTWALVAYLWTFQFDFGR